MSGIVLIIPKNKNEEIHISLDEFNGHNLASIRIYYYAKGSEWHPTKKGLSVNVDKLDDEILGLQNAKEQAQENGWL